MQFPPVEEQLAVIRRGVVDLVDEDDLRKRLEQSRESGVPLRVKFGIDPSAPDIHLGHTCLLYTSPSPRDATLSRMPSSA